MDYRGPSAGAVVVYASSGRTFARRHDKSTRVELAKRLAVLKGMDFLGEHDRTRTYLGPLYFVPSDTLVIREADRLGIRNEHDLFGGVVPHPFVATKAITHPLTGPDACRPEGWSDEFAHRAHDAVLLGFSVFSSEDAYRACSCLLDHGPVRIKPVRATGGCGQVVISAICELNAALESVDDGPALSDGLVLEQNLSEVTTYSVGQVRVGDLLATYYGTQRLTPDNSGAAVYGGSTLDIVRGDFVTLLKQRLPERARLAITQAQTYDSAAKQCFPGFFASRRNYDVAQGLDSGGRLCSGVLEQSWRLGGASSAEIAALEAFQSEPTLGAVRVSSVETYGPCDTPPHATVNFRGIDDQVGMITKYALVERYGDAQ